MKISGCIIQNRQIIEFTNDNFNANYKGKRIYITTNHGFGLPKSSDLRRYSIDVVDIKTCLCDVETYEDFHCIEEAINYALHGAMLIDNQTAPATDTGDNGK